MMIADHDIEWLMKPDFCNKKKCSPNLGPACLNQAQSEVFCHFLTFSSLVFFEIAYNDSLQQCLTFSRGKAHEKKLGA